VRHIYLLLRVSDARRYSDPLDFISCLCLFACEAAKLRKRLFSPAVTGLLHSYVSARATETPEQQKELLARLPLSAHEAQGLRAIWPNDVVHKCVRRRSQRHCRA
jgi:hypothetical protein